MPTTREKINTTVKKMTTEKLPARDAAAQLLSKDPPADPHKDAKPPEKSEEKDPPKGADAK